MFLLLYYRLIIGITIACCVTCNKRDSEKRRQCFKRLQSDIQRFANEEMMTNNNVINSKWTLKKIGNIQSGKKFKVNIERSCYSEVLQRLFFS
jgi:hypothetical protein